MSHSQPCLHLNVFLLSFLAVSWAPRSIWAQTPGMVTIHCRIVDDLRQEPIPRVRLTLSGAALKDMIGLDSDGDGRCQFPTVPPGHYTLGFDKAGFFPPDDAKSGLKSVITFDASAGSDVDLGTITLVRGRSISGAVRWDNEEPAEKVAVHALKVRRGRAAFVIGDSIIVGTNSRGEFKLDNLRPGRYVVYAYVLGLALAVMKPRMALPCFIRTLQFRTSETRWTSRTQRKLRRSQCI